MGKTTLIRFLFWSALIIGGLVPWLIGAYRIAAAGGTHRATTITQTVRPLDTDAPAALAAAFTVEYLTFDPGNANAMAARAERLKAFGGSDSFAGLVPSKETKAQAATFAWPASRQDTSPDGTRGVITVRAVVSGSRTLYLAVPVAMDDAGRWGVTGFPHFTPAPGAAQVPNPVEGQFVDDSDGSIRALLTGFLRAYAGGTPADLTVYMAPEASAPHSLAGTIKAQLREVNEVRLTSSASGTIQAVVVATLVDQESGAGYRQMFRFELAQSAGRWAVSRFD